MLALGLSAPPAVHAKEPPADLITTGIEAALAKKDASGLYAVLEAGRAMQLTQTLQGRTLLRGQTLDPKHQAELDAARRNEARARQLVLREYQKKGVSLKKRRVLYKQLQEAQARHAAVLTRIITGRKPSGTPRLTPTPINLSTTRVLLRDDGVLVHYLVSRKNAWALVVNGDGARIVDLGKRAPVDAALAALGTPRADRDVAALLRPLQRLLAAPLKLTKARTRVIVVPGIRFHHVPFGALMATRDVVRAPSASVFAELVRGKPQRDAKGLGVVDPHYAGQRLTHLPGTRDEVGDAPNVILQGKDASETKFVGTLSKQPRWRMIHFGAHVLIDHKVPMRSAIALTADEQNDGRLTALEILRLKIPADLVIVSGCESLRGKLVKHEGVLGLHRSFLVAGARSVLGCLWCTDSVTTTAFMKRFHALWRPEEGEGVPAARALRMARDHIRAQKQWASPYYWAGWELVGDPD